MELIIKNYGKYKCIKPLKGGGFSIVYEMLDVVTKNKYAFKVIKSSIFTDMLKNEYKALKTFKNNSSFLPFYGGTQYKDEFIFKFALAKDDNLKQYIEKYSVISENKTKDILRQLISQIKYAHTHKIIHNDIKPENIVLNNGKYYLIDWGVCQFGENNNYEISMTDELFVSPEHYNMSVRYASDIYMLGHVLYYVLHGRLLFGLYRDMSDEHKMISHLSKVPKYKSELSQEFIKLLNGMLCKNPEKRIDIEDIEYFLKYNKMKNKKFDILEYPIPKNNFKYENIYKFYSQCDVKVATFKYAIELEDKKEYEKSFQIYESLAKKDNSRAMNNLGYIYDAGVGVEINYKKAFYWYRKASKNNHPMGIYNLGLMYEYGKGVEQSIEYAQKLYKISAKKGYIKANNKFV